MAGFFDFVTDLFADEVQEEMPVHNSQNMPILAAVININPDPVDNLPDLVVDDGALEANVGPMGTPLEIIEQSASDKVIVYIVRQGDTIGTLAEMFGVSQSTILWANDGKRSLKEGDELVILPISGIKYVIKKGDTIAGIAKKFKGDADEIIRFNDLGDELIAGTEIIIPDGEMTPSAPVGGASGTVGSPAGTSGYFIRPTAGRLTQGPHGPRKSAVDIANKVGTSVYAAASGKVIVAKSGGYNGGYGTYIVIEHPNGMQSLYAHLSSLNVSAGETVGQGDLIGGMGATGKVTGPHLHFQINGSVYGWNPVSK